jgi:hypothetical protein
MEVFILLTFEQKLAVVESFPELQRNQVSLGRLNFHYEQSAYDKKIVVYHLHPNGNGFVYAGRLKGYQKDDKGMVNIRDYTVDELRSLIKESIQSLSTNESEIPPRAIDANTQEERWAGPDDQTLRVYFEDDLWYVYAGLNLESAFETYDEVEAYMREEGFTMER